MWQAVLILEKTITINIQCMKVFPLRNLFFLTKKCYLSYMKTDYPDRVKSIFSSKINIEVWFEILSYIVDRKLRLMLILLKEFMMGLRPIQENLRQVFRLFKSHPRLCKRMRLK